MRLASQTPTPSHPPQIRKPYIDPFRSIQTVPRPGYLLGRKHRRRHDPRSLASTEARHYYLPSVICRLFSVLQKNRPASNSRQGVFLESYLGGPNSQRLNQVQPPCGYYHPITMNFTDCTKHPLRLWMKKTLCSYRPPPTRSVRGPETALGAEAADAAKVAPTGKFSREATNTADSLPAVAAQPRRRALTRPQAPHSA